MIIWQVNDLRISHKSRDVVISIINQLAVIVEKDTLLTIPRGKVHKYLRMAFDFTNKGKGGCQDGQVLTRKIF